MVSVRDAAAKPAVNLALGGTLDNWKPGIDYFKALKKNRPIIPIQGEAMAIGDRIAVMNHGQIVQTGTPRDIYYKPASSFVADFIGTMNRVSGTLRDGSLELPGGRIPWTQEGAGTMQVLFRPNDARIVNEAEAQVRGVVEQQIFLGDRTRLHVSGVADGIVVVETSEHREFRVGQSVGLRIEPGALLRLRD